MSAASRSDTVRFWCNLFGAMFAAEIWEQRVLGMRPSHWRWHLGEVFAEIDSGRLYPQRPVDHEGEVG